MEGRSPVLTDSGTVRRSRPDPELQAGRYHLESVLGTGGASIVFRAWDRRRARAVAVKVPKEIPEGPRIARTRLLSEAAALLAVRHPNLVGILDFCAAEERPQLVMELIEGPSLADLFLDPDIGLQRRVRLVAMAARGTAALHERGILHRDLKPANVLLTSCGRAKVIDLGLAYRLGSPAVSRETDPIIEGTVLYMAPEQVDGIAEILTPRTDVYALGAILYEACTGCPPHDGPTVCDVLEQILDTPPVPPRELNPSIPPALERIILAAMTPSPSCRIPSATELAGRLETLLR